MSPKKQRDGLYARPQMRAAIVGCKVPRDLQIDVEAYVSKYAADEIFEKLEEKERIFASTMNKLVLNTPLGDPRLQSFFDKHHKSVDILEWSWKVANELVRSSKFYQYFGVAPHKVVMGTIPETFRRLVSVEVKQQELCDVGSNVCSGFNEIHQEFVRQIDRVKQIGGSEMTYQERLTGFFRYVGGDIEVHAGYPIGLYQADISITEDPRPEVESPRSAFVEVKKNPRELESALYQACLYGICFAMNGNACRSPIPVAAVSFPDGRFEAGTVTFELQADGGIGEMPQLEIIRSPAGGRGWNIFEEKKAKQLVLFLGNNISLFPE